MNAAITSSHAKEKTMQRSNSLMQAIPAGIGLLAMLAASQSHALSYRQGDLSISLQNRISAGLAVRTRNPNPEFIGIANGGEAFSTNTDDANKNFDSSGDVVSAPVKLLTDFSASYGDYRMFVRTGLGFDGVLFRRNNFDPANYGPGMEADFDELEEKNRAITSEVGRYAEFLDAYIAGSHFLANRNVSWRVGRQIINWGESTFIQNGLNAIIAANANRAGVPGAELEEIFIPAAKVWASMDLIRDVSIEGWYQLQWEPTLPFLAGTFFSTADFISPSGTRTNIGFGRVIENSPPGTPCAAPPAPGVNCVPFGSSIPRDADRNASNSGQFGGALRTFVPVFGGTDLAVYGTRYHSRLPIVSGISRTDGTANTQTSAYLLEYPEDIQMYGMSFSMAGPFGTSVQGEYSFKVDQPLQIDDVEILLAGLGAPGGQLAPNFPLPTTLGNQYIRGFNRHNVHQVIGAFTKLFDPDVMPGSDALVLLFEAGYNRVNGFPDEAELRYEAPGTPLPGDPAVAAGQGLPAFEGSFATRSSWGYKMVLAATYNNVFGQYTVIPSIRFDHDVNGITPLPLGNFVQGRRQVQFGMGMEYLARWRFDLGYTMFTGGGGQNLLRDRDFVQMAVRYSF